MGTPPDPFGAPMIDEDFEVDLTNETGSGLMPDGPYKVRVENVKKELSKNDAPMFTWDFVIIEGKYVGRKLRMWTSLSDAALFKLVETLVALGLGKEGEVARFTKAQAVGRVCIGHITHSVYQGNDRNQLSKVVPLPENNGGTPSAMPSSGTPAQQQVPVNALP